MKILKYIVLAAGLSFGLTSCNSLDLAPEDYYGSESFWTNEAQVNGFVLGMHSQMRSLSTNFFLMGEARGGLQKSGTSSTATSLDYSSPFKDQDFTKDKTGLGSWGGMYPSILNINLGIHKIENETPFLSDDARNYFLGQLYGIRAYYYFWMYRTYGGVPLVTETKVLDGYRHSVPLLSSLTTTTHTIEYVYSDI